jgi:hypothetical protein
MVFMPPMGCAWIGAQSPRVALGVMTISLHARAIRAPAEMALEFTKAIVCRSVWFLM